MPADARSIEPRPRALHFDATAWEYFRIWLPGACLTWLTLGVYAAWAAVRRSRYLVVRTTLDGLPFGYEARPWPLFVWRALRVVMVAGAWLALELSYVGPLVFLGFAFFLPAVLVRLARFLARAHTYRGEPGEFTGTTRAFARIHKPALVCACLSLVPLVEDLALLSYPSSAPWHLVNAVARAVLCFWMIVNVETVTRNALAQHTQWNGVSFTSRLEPDSMLWLRLTNFLASCLSLGLLIPWAEVRARRHYLSRLRVLPS